VLLALLLAHGIRCQSAGEKTSEFLKKTFANYDKVLRPNYGGDPVEVIVSGYILDISDIDELNQEFTITLYLRHEWKDARLQFTESEVGTKQIPLNEEYTNKIWRPDTFIVNERESRGHDLITGNQFMRLSPNGTVRISKRYSIKVTCSLSLGWFPFDRHTCPVMMESYGYSRDDYIYKWREDDQGNANSAIKVSKEVTSIKFTVAAINIRKETIQLAKSYSRLTAEFFFIRDSTRFVHEIYFPAVLLTLLSFITLLHGTGTPMVRLLMSVLVEGFMILLMAISAKTVPPVGYQTALDFYLCICLVLITCVVIANVAISLILSNNSETNGVVRLRSVNEEGGNPEDEGKEVFFDTGSRFTSKTNRAVTLSVKLRFVIPIIFVVFNLLYWMVVLIGSSFYPEDFLILEDIGNN
jgi:hypothetical protein